MYCCAECFGDRGLEKGIIPSLSTVTGTCSYCASVDRTVLEPAHLSDYFELLVSAYQKDPDGKLLVQWFREDWGLFQHPRMDDYRAQALLAEVLDDGEIVRQLFSPAPALEADWLTAWEKLRDELMYRNRFFPDANVDLERLASLLSPLLLEPDEIPRQWYRARLQTSDIAFLNSEMGAPPKRNASHGRANPAGIPYLYLGSTPDTAIAEIRPHTGETACVADFTTPPDLKLVDLRSPRRMVSPFELEDAEQILRLRSAVPFLERLGEELTRPVLPELAAIHYTPSQYLCEFIKKCGYDGVIYRSSVSDGINLALFDPTRAAVGGVIQYRVSGVSVETVKTAL